MATRGSQGRTLTLTAAEHKAGRATGDDRVIGLPALAVAIIDRQERRRSRDYVFAAAHGNGRIDLSKPWRAVRYEAKLPERIGRRASPLACDAHGDGRRGGV